MKQPRPMATRITRVRLTMAGVYWLLAAASFAAIGIYKSINLILILSYFLLVLLLLNWWLVRASLRCVTAHVDPLDDGFVGEGRRVRCWVENRSRPLRGLQVIAAVAGQQCRWYLAMLPANVPTLLTRIIPLEQRGLYSNSQIHVRHSFPFGLVESSVVIPVDRPTAIYPERGQLDLSRLLRKIGSDSAHRGQHRATVRQLAEGTDLHGLRPLRPGDSPRWIHWRTTARIGELMVREFDRATGPSVNAIVMPAHDPSAFEKSLTCAATLIWEWTRRQDGRLRLWIWLENKWEHWNLDHRRRAVDLLRRLAAAQFVAGSATPLPELPSRGSIVYITHERKMPVSGAAFQRIDPIQADEVYRPPIATP